MTTPYVDELLRPLVRTYEREVWSIARIKLSRSAWKMRFFVKDGDEEAELGFVLCRGAVERIEHEVRRRGMEFADQIARRLFQHIGFVADSVDNVKRCETEWFRK